MRLTLAQLEAFHWTMRLGSAHAAAERLHLSQPTISVRIRALERGLERKLFERRGGRLRATTAGAALAVQAEQMLGLATRIGHDGADPLRTRLRLGAPDSFAMVCLPRLLGLLERDYPELTVDISVDNSLVLNRRLNQRDLDLAFISNPEVGEGVRSEMLGAQDLAWVASPRLKLAGRTIRPRDLAGCQIFTNPDPSRLHALVRDWFGRAGVEPGRISTCNSLVLMRRLIVSSAGASLMPTAILQAELRSGVLQRLATRPAIQEQRLYAAYHADAAGPGIATILAITRRMLARTRFLAR
jgi:DNA-binding transcriptional LysR family regulator